MHLRKSISLIMLLLIVFHGVFQLFIFKIFQAKYREEVLEIIKDGVLEDKLTFFAFSKDDLKNGTTLAQWMEEDEFRFNDEMYDVVKEEIHGDSVYFYCIHDENESRLYAVLDKYFQQLLEEDPDKVRDLNTLNSSLSRFYSKPIDIENNSALVSNTDYSAELIPDLLDGEHFLVIPPPRS